MPAIPGPRPDQIARKPSIPNGYVLTTTPNGPDWAPGGSGGTIFLASQPSHGLQPGQPIYYGGQTTGWILAKADNENTTADAIVFEVIDNDNFKYITSGEIELTEAEWNAITGSTSGLTPGEHYRLDDTISGGLTQAPAGFGINQFILRALSTTKALVYMGEPHSGVATSSTLKVSSEGSLLPGAFDQLDFNDNFKVTQVTSTIAKIEPSDIITVTPSDIPDQTSFQNILTQYRVIYFKPGTYFISLNSPLTIQNGTRLIGSGVDKTGSSTLTKITFTGTFTPTGGQLAVFNEPTNQPANIEVHGLFFDSPSLSTNIPLFNITSTSIIKNCKFSLNILPVTINGGLVENCVFDSLSSTSAIIISNTNILLHTRITGCNFNNVSDYAITINSSSNTLISECIFTSCDGGINGATSSITAIITQCFFNTVGSATKYPITGFNNANSGTQITWNSFQNITLAPNTINLLPASGVNRARCWNNTKLSGDAAFNIDASWHTANNISAT